MDILFPRILSKAWQLTRRYFLFFIPILVLEIIIGTVPNLLVVLVKNVLFLTDRADLAHPGALAFLIIVVLLRIVLPTWIGMGLIRILLDGIDGKLQGKPRELMLLFAYWRHVPAFIGAGFLYTLMIILGSVFFLIPGIILALVFCLWSFFIIDKGYSPIKSLKASMIATRGMRWALFLYMFAFLGINLLGALALGVGLFFTIPVTAFAMACIYRELAVRMETVPISVASQSLPKTSPKSKK